MSLDTSPPYVVIDRQISRTRAETTPTKAKDTRTPPLPAFLADILSREPRKSRWVVSFRGEPLSENTLRQRHDIALTALGINPADARARGLSFHSWRSWFNTSLRAKVPDATLRRVIGHADDAMTARYDNSTPTDLAPVAGVLEGIWSKT